MIERFTHVSYEEIAEAIWKNLPDIALIPSIHAQVSELDHGSEGNHGGALAVRTVGGLQCSWNSSKHSGCKNTSQCLQK